MNGEANTKFFHAQAAITRRRTKTLRLKDENDNWVDDRDALKEMARQCFQQLYMQEPCTPCTGQECVFSKLEETDVVGLNRRVTADEVKMTIFQMGVNKALGPDGLPPFFFHKNWDIVGDSICKFVS